jgi:hypothetical protein
MSWMPNHSRMRFPKTDGVATFDKEVANHPRFWKRSAYQIRCWVRSQAKNLAFGGAQDFHTQILLRSTLRDHMIWANQRMVLWSMEKMDPRNWTWQNIAHFQVISSWVSSLRCMSCSWTQSSTNCVRCCMHGEVVPYLDLVNPSVILQSLVDFSIDE